MQTPGEQASKAQIMATFEGLPAEQLIADAVIYTQTFDSVVTALHVWVEQEGGDLRRCPTRMRERFELAIDFYALGVEQLTLGRDHLFNHLMDNATNSANLALELALKAVIPTAKPSVREGIPDDRVDLRGLGKLLNQAKGQGIIRASGEFSALLDFIKQHRDDITHGHREADHFGVAALPYIRMVLAVTITVLNSPQALEGKFGPDTDFGQEVAP